MSESSTFNPAEAYELGLVGSDCSTMQGLFSTLESFYDYFPQVENIGRGRVSLPFRASMLFDDKFVGDPKEAQQQGDCVGKAVANAATVDYCVDAAFGETKFQGRICDENIYKARGHSGEGANCSQLCSYIGPNGSGGLLVRKKYEGPNGQVVDLSKYNPSWSRNGSAGNPKWLNDIAAQNKALKLLKCNSPEEVRDAIYMGFGIVACGGEGYSNKRNEDGLSEIRGSWAHAKAIIGFDGSQNLIDKYGGCGIFLMAHDWGLWNSGPKRHEQPDGSWWIRHSAVKVNWCMAICSVRGYDRVLDFDVGSKVEGLT